MMELKKNFSHLSYSYTLEFSNVSLMIGNIQETDSECDRLKFASLFEKLVCLKCLITEVAAGWILLQLLN